MGASGSGRVDLSGAFPLALEPGARLVVPRLFRRASPGGLWVACPWPLPAARCVSVFTPEGWDDVIVKVQADSGVTSEAVRTQVLRALRHSAVELKVDKAGRLCLGSPLAARAGIVDVETVVAAGNGRCFEVYTQERFKAVEEADKLAAAGTLERLGLG